MQRIAVIDNSTLVNLTKLLHLQIFEHLRLVFTSIHVPAKTLQEYEQMLPYEPDRKHVIKQIKMAGSSFLVFCNKYDTISLKILETTKGIDPGEAEAAAQRRSVNSQYVISDDRNFIKALQKTDRHTRVIGTLHLIAFLDFAKLIMNPADYLKIIYANSPFKSAQLRDAYTEIASDLSIAISKKELGKKTSLKTLGLK